MAAKLKIYKMAYGNGMFPYPVLTKLRAQALIPSHTVQGTTLVVAHTKADAARLVDRDASDLRLAVGNDVQKLVAAGMLDDENTVLAYHHAVKNTAVLDVNANRVVGYWRHSWDNGTTFEKSV